MCRIDTQVPRIVDGDRQHEAAGARAQPQIKQRGGQHAQGSAERRIVRSEKARRDDHTAPAERRAADRPARGEGAVRQREQHAAKGDLLDQSRHDRDEEPGRGRDLLQAAAGDGVQLLA